MQRRRFIQAAAATTSASVLAGCFGLGRQSNNPSDTITAAIAPVGPFALQMQYIEENNLLENYMDEAGYDYSIEQTFGYPSLYTSGQVDVIFENPPMLARMAAEQGINSVSFGMNAKNPLMASVAGDSPYRVSQTGSPEESIQQAASDGAVYGMEGWVTAATALHQLLYDEWGVTMTQEESDFEVMTTDFGAITNLLMEGELDLAINFPLHPGHSASAVNGQGVVPLFHFWDVQDTLGFDAPVMLGGPATKQDVWDESREGVIALTKAFNEANKWYREQLINRELHDRDDIGEVLGKQSNEAAQFYMDWAAGNDLVELWGEEFEPWTIPEATVSDSYYLTDDIISTHKDFTDRIVDVGFVEEDWQDYVTFEQVDELQ